MGNDEKKDDDGDSSELDINGMLEDIEEEMDLGELMKQKEKLQKKLGLDSISEDDLGRGSDASDAAATEKKVIEVHSDAEPEVVEIKSDSDVEHLYDRNKRDRSREKRRNRDRDRNRERDRERPSSKKDLLRDRWGKRGDSRERDRERPRSRERERRRSRDREREKRELERDRRDRDRQRLDAAREG